MNRPSPEKRTGPRLSFLVGWAHRVTGETRSAARCLGWVLAGCLVLGLSPGLPPAAAKLSGGAGRLPGADQVRVSLHPSTRVLAPSHRIRLDGRAFGVRPGTRVTIFRRPEAGLPWTPAGATRVRRHGRFGWSQIVDEGDRYYRACVIRRQRRFCSSGHLVRLVPEVRFRVQVSAPASLPPGSSAVLKGRVSPEAGGQLLRILRRRVGTNWWHQIAAVQTGPDGRFRFRTPALPLGNWEFKVFKPITDTGRPAGTTVQVAVGTITFEEMPKKTRVSDQYRDYGVVFTSKTVIRRDDAAVDTPVLSGVPRFQGPIRVRFVQPETRLPATVDRFSLVVGYIDAPHQVKVDYFGIDGTLLGTVDLGEEGFNRVLIALPGVASFSVEIRGTEEYGFALDDFSIGPTTAIPGARPLRVARPEPTGMPTGRAARSTRAK